MTLPDLVCRRELAEEMRDLGVAQKSIFYWQWRYTHRDGEEIFEIVSRTERNAIRDRQIAAWTSGELFIMLGIHVGEGRPQYANESEADYRSALLIFLLKQNLISVVEINKRLEGK